MSVPTGKTGLSCRSKRLRWQSVRDIDPDVPIGCLFWDSIETGLAITREYDCEAIHPPYNMIQGTPFFEDEYYLSGPFAEIDLVETAHEEGRDLQHQIRQTSATARTDRVGPPEPTPRTYRLISDAAEQWERVPLPRSRP